MDQQLLQVLLSLAEEVGTPRALSVKLLCESGEWLQLQQLKVRPYDYTNAEDYWRDCLVTDFLRKCDLQTEVDREAAARATFLSCEQENARTNARLARYCKDTLFLEAPDVPVYDFICRWRKEVSFVMGNLPDHLTPRFSGGATYADTGLLTTIPDKMSSSPTYYQGTACLIPMWEETAWARSLRASRPYLASGTAVRGNIFFTVPKDGTTFRGCCKEASLPLAYQLDIGRLLKVRLQRIGIDLKHGQLWHRHLAREASVTGAMSTIDMSNASDTLCRVLPRLVLPELWHELLDSLRATHTRVMDRWYRLEKFSSMGNGFTFELETVIFATLARTVVSGEGGDPDSVSCYGDDLIVPAEHASSVLSALRFFGFTPNRKKTFVEGPFRESCGGDFWQGTPVRAHFVQELPDEPQHWISIANGLRRVARADGAPSSRWGIVRRAWFRALARLPSHIRRLRGPEGLGDAVIHDDESTFEPVKGPVGTETWDQQWFQAYVPVHSVLPWHHWMPETQLASCLVGCGPEGVIPRGSVSGYRIARIPYGVHSDWVPHYGRNYARSN